MKLKGIKPVEQHVEKIVIGVVATAGLGLVGVQFFTPSTVEVGGAKVSVADAFRPATDASERAKAAMENPEPRLPADVVTAGNAVLAIGSAAGSTVKAADIALGAPPSFGKGGGDRAVARASYVLPQVDAPASIVAHCFRSTVSPLERIATPELGSLLPDVQPFDKAAVTLESVFDGTALRRQLESDPDGESGPMTSIPLGWWRDAAADAAVSSMVQVVGVQVERETLRLADGTTPPSPLITTVGVIPGRADGLKTWNESVKSLGDVPPMIDEYRRLEEEILRPPYLSTIAGPAWRPASELAAAAASSGGDGKSRRIADARRRLAEVDERIADLERRIATAPGDDRRRDEGRPGEGGGGRGGGGGGGGKGGAGGGNANAPAPRRDEQPANKAQLERQLASRVEERKRIVKTLEDLGEQAEATAADAPVETVKPLLDNPAVRLFAHDLTVEPGAQYRYRMRAVVNNPLYGRNLQDSQRTLADRSLIEGAWSAWSTPVDVDPSEFFFVTSAEPRSEINRSPKAAAEMYVFYYGYYRVASVSLEPGDMLAGTARLPELKLADMKKLEESVAGDPSAALPTAPAAPVAPGGRTPGGGRDREREAVDRGQGGGVISDGQQAGGVDWLTVPAKRNLELRVNAVYLDTLPVAVGRQGLAGEEQVRFAALMRDQLGRVVWRLPDVERTADVYRRLEASAREGERQGAPEIKPQENRRQPQRPDRSRTPSPPPSKGSGGSGG